MKTFDGIVLGLGGMGSAAAFHLAARGHRVLGLDQYQPVHDRGSSHGGSRIIRQAYYENPAYVPLLQCAYELWEQLEHDSGYDLLRLTGGLMIGPPASPIVNGAIASATEHNLPYETLSANELRRRYPVFEPRPDDAAVYELRAGFLRPELCVRAHLEQAAHCGAQLHFEERVEGWHAAAGGVRVKTSRANYEAERLVIAPGAWAPALLKEIGVPFEIRRHVMGWFEPREQSQSFLPERFPIYMWDVNGSALFYGFPVTGDLREGVKIAMHSGGEICTADSVDRAVHERDVEELRGHMKHFLPALDGPLVSAAVCMYTLTPDEHFILSLHPEHPHVAIAAGFSGHGFKFTSVVGEILADLITTGVTRHPIELFAPDRFI